MCLFSIRVSFHDHWQLTGQQGRGYFRYLFATLHVRWRTHIFNRNASIYRLIELLFNWLMMWCCLSFVCLLIWFWVLLQLLDVRNRWISTRVDYHPCITSEPTNQVCESPQVLRFRHCTHLCVEFYSSICFFFCLTIRFEGIR